MRIDAKLGRDEENPANAPLRWPRPRTIALIRCHNANLEGLTIKDSPGYNIHLVYCQDVVVDGLTAFHQQHAHGTDCIIVDSSRRVRISNCALSSGGDCIGLKSGHNEEGRRIGLPTEDVLIVNCHMYKSFGSGIGIGSETAGSIRDVVVSNCVIRECFRGAHIRSPRGRGGVVEKVQMSNLVIDQVQEMAVKVSNYYDSLRLEGQYVTAAAASRQNRELARSRTVPVDEGTPTFRDFAFSGLTVGKAREVALVEGLPERYIQGLRFDNITVAQSSAGIFCTMAREVSISNFRVNTMEAPAVDARDVEKLELHQLRCAHPGADGPLVWLENVTGAFLHGCNVASPGPGFDWLKQEQCRAVTLTANHVPART
jgi:hypothetical protein